MKDLTNRRLLQAGLICRQPLARHRETYVRRHGEAVHGHPNADAVRLRVVRHVAVSLPYVAGLVDG